jgi:hypothetical protein
MHGLKLPSVHLYEFKISNTKNGNEVEHKGEMKFFINYTIMTINLGITWLLFSLYVNKKSSYFSYAFIVLNGSQVSYLTNI